TCGRARRNRHRRGRGPSSSSSAAGPTTRPTGDERGSGLRGRGCLGGRGSGFMGAWRFTMAKTTRSWMARATRVVAFGGALGVAVGCGIPKEQYDRDVGALREQVATLEQERSALELRASQCDESRVTCERELSAM